MTMMTTTDNVDDYSSAIYKSFEHVRAHALQTILNKLTEITGATQ